MERITHAKFGNTIWSDINSYTLSREKTLINHINLLNPYLYILDYSKYNYNYALDYLKHSFSSPFACSSYRHNNIYARNFDWYYSNGIEFIVKTPATGKRKLTIGVTFANSLKYPDYNPNKWYDYYKILPFIIVDGINSDGVFCNDNVVNAAGVEFVRTTGTTPTEEKLLDLSMLMIPRFVLDYFSTALEAIDFLQKHVSVYAPKQTMDYEYHFMIGDPQETYIVEFINNELVSHKVGDTYPAVMTNFKVTDIIINNNEVDYNSVETYGCGVERYNTILSNYLNYNTQLEALTFMSNDLKYTNTYTLKNWPTEYTTYWDNPEHTGEMLTVQDVINHPERFTYMLEEGSRRYLHRDRDANNPNFGIWQTVHTSVYDINERSLMIRTLESPLYTYKITLN